MPLCIVYYYKANMDAKTHIQHSFVEGSLNSPFSIHNLPYGVFRPKQSDKARVGVAIGDYVLDLALLEAEALLPLKNQESLFNQDALNAFAACGPKVWSLVRQRIQHLLHKDNDELQYNAPLLQKALIPVKDVMMQLPFRIGGFTDFYASEHHATNVGRLFRPNDQPLLPNWKHIPVGYNGRASTVFVSGTPIHRPKGQIKPPTADAPFFSPSLKLDFELELGFFVGAGNPEGKPISVNDASSHIFGVVLLNDWSARDIQAFEYQPLGPFLSKGFATSISPWVVPFEALEQAQAPLAKQSPEPLEYLYQQTPTLADIRLTVELLPRGSSIGTPICETNAKSLYWSMEQMLAHHTVNGCIMKPGDLLGTGTISGPEEGSWGSLLEISFNGKKPIQLQDGQERTFLEEGDTVIMSGCYENGAIKIGFGSVDGMILAPTS